MTEFMWTVLFFAAVQKNIVERTKAHSQGKFMQARTVKLCVCFTCVVLYKLLHCVKLRPGGDVITAVVQFTDLIMLHMFPLVVVPVTDGQRVSTWTQNQKLSA